MKERRVATVAFWRSKVATFRLYESRWNRSSSFSSSSSWARLVLAGLTSCGVGIVGSVRVGSSFFATAGSMNFQTSPPTAFVLTISSHSSQSLGLDRMTVDFCDEVIVGVDVYAVYAV